MANSQDQFEARVRDTHKRLRRYENGMKELEAYFHERPQRAADALLLSVPAQLEVWRKYALSRFKVDLEDREQRKKQRWTNLADAWEYTLLAIKSAFQNRHFRCSRQTGAQLEEENNS
jgi:hypothetical protein